MLDILIFIFISIGIGVLFALPGFAFGLLLEKYKIASNRVSEVLAFSVFFVFIKRIWYPNMPYIWLAGILMLGTTVGLYNMEIYWAMKNKDKIGMVDIVMRDLSRPL
mgnify:CR=1 FL=1